MNRLEYIIYELNWEVNLTFVFTFVKLGVLIFQILLTVFSFTKKKYSEKKQRKTDGTSFKRIRSYDNLLGHR